LTIIKKVKSRNKKKRHFFKLNHIILRTCIPTVSYYYLLILPLVRF